MDRSLDGGHEASTHINTASTEGERTGQTFTVGIPTGGDERNTQLLGGAAEEDKVRDIVLADVAGTLEAVDGEEIDAELLRREGVADGGTLVEDGDSGGFELLDDGAGVVAGGLD